jgi:hypothetical protein
VLSFLVTSNARRHLLQLLWGEGAAGSCTELASKAGVAFANAYRELQAMKDLELVTTELQGAALAYRANDGHPDADLLRQLVARRPVGRPPDDHADHVRGWLIQLGAPLADGNSDAPPPRQEDALADGVKLAHRDAAVARVLPLCFWYHRDHLDFGRLAARARRDREKHALGFFLDLTTELSKDRRFAKFAAELRDRRVHQTHDFFPGAALTPRARAQAERNTPAVARRWGYRMNMDLENFRSLFEKFADAPVHT